MKALLAQVEAQYQNQLPFVVFRKPHKNKVKAYLQLDATPYTSANFQEAGFVFATFDGTSNYCIPTQKSHVLVAEFEASTATLFSVDTPFVESAKVDFESLVSKAISSIQAGQFEKVVLSRKELVAWPDIELAALINRLFSLYPTAFCYAWFHPDTGLWLGASPEQLVKIQVQTIHTIALGAPKNLLKIPDGAQKKNRNSKWLPITWSRNFSRFANALNLLVPIPSKRDLYFISRPKLERSCIPVFLYKICCNSCIQPQPYVACPKLLPCNL